MEKELKSTALKEQLNQNKAVAIVPTGNSMWPTLKSKSQTVVVQKNQTRAREFDVVLFVLDDGRHVLHRVMRVENDGYITCGDGMLACERVEEARVIGVMTGLYKKNKFISVNEPKYVNKVKRFYKRKLLRKARLKCFYFRQVFKAKFKMLFRKGDKNV